MGSCLKKARGGGLERWPGSSEGLLLLGRTLGISRLPVTRAAGRLTPSSGLHGYLHDVHVSMCIYLIKIK